MTGTTRHSPRTDLVEVVAVSQLPCLTMISLGDRRRRLSGLHMDRNVGPSNVDQRPAAAAITAAIAARMTNLRQLISADRAFTDR
jgi:hypothetical protein